MNKKLYIKPKVLNHQPIKFETVVSCNRAGNSHTCPPGNGMNPGQDNVIFTGEPKGQQKK